MVWVYCGLYGQERRLGETSLLLCKPFRAIIIVKKEECLELLTLENKTNHWSRFRFL